MPSAGGDSMKTAFFAIVLATSAIAFAKDSDAVEGAQATQLLAEMKATGAAMDCGMGRCGTSIQEIHCSGDDCSLKIEDQTGGYTETNLVGQPAIDLMNALMNAGAPVSALWSIEEVDCTTANMPDGGEDNCRIDYN